MASVNPGVFQMVHTAWAKHKASIPHVSNGEKISVPFSEWPEDKARKQEQKCPEKVDINSTFYLQVTTSSDTSIKSPGPY